MNALVRLLVILLLPLLSLTGCGQGNPTDSADGGPAPVDTAYLADFSDLLLTISTRPGVTAPADTEIIAAATTDAARVFSDNLGDTADRKQFADLVAAALQDFTTAYGAAGQSATPDLAHGTAVDGLHSSLQSGAGQSGIHSEQLELALLAAGAFIENRVAAALSPVGRESVRVCWVEARSVEFQRVYFDRLRESLLIFGVPTTVTDRVNQITPLLLDNLPNMLSALEAGLYDPTVLQDSALINQILFNNFAQTDLQMLRLALELFVSAGTTEIDALIARMNSLTGMASVTRDTLVAQGIIDLDGAGQPWLKLGDQVTYNWIQPDMSLSYQSPQGFADELLALGGTLPVAGDLAPFVSPYLDIFKLKQDADICNEITRIAFDLAGDPTIPAPPTIRELSGLRQGQASCRDRVLAGLSGVTAAEKQAIGTLLFLVR